MPGKILLVEHRVTERIMLMACLSEACYDVVLADSGADALTRLHLDAPQAVLLASDLPGTDCVRLCAALRTATYPAHLPLLVMSNAPAPATRTALLKAGADEVMPRPVPMSELLARLRGLLRQDSADREWSVPSQDFTPTPTAGFAEGMAGFAHHARVALITDDADTERALTATLGDHMHISVSPQSFSGALARLGQNARPEIIALAPARAADLPATLSLLSDLGARPLMRDGARIVLLPPCARDSVADCIDRGADDVIHMPACAQEIALRIQRQGMRKADRNRARDTLRDGLRAAVRDPLTGLHNRRFAMPRLARIVERALITERPFAVLMADIDHFKRINDRFGHAMGDAVLTEVADRLRAPLRAPDLIARVGGEEFLIVLPETDAVSAKRLAQSLCHSVADMPVGRAERGEPINVTLSIGASTARIVPGGLDVETLISAADRALYASKAAGRNKVTFRPIAA